MLCNWRYQEWWVSGNKTWDIRSPNFAAGGTILLPCGHACRAVLLAASQYSPVCYAIERAQIKKIISSNRVFYFRISSEEPRCRLGMLKSKGNP